MWRNLKNGIIYIAVRVALFFLSRLPKTVIRPAGDLLGMGALSFAKKDKNIARKQLVNAFEGRLSARRQRILLKGVATALGRNFLEAVHLMQRSSWPDIHLPKNAKNALDSALADGAGVIFVTGHIGNWELLAACLARHGYPIHTVVRQSYDARFTQMIDEARNRLGVRTVFRGEPGAAAAMLRILRGGGILGFLIDQDTDVPSTFVPFFGRPAKTPIGPAVFAHRCGSKMVIGSIHRQRNGVHCIEISPFLPRRDILDTTASLSTALEGRIRKRPSQWVWFHRRWKSRSETN